MDTNNNDDVLTLEEAAKYLKMHYQTALEKVRSGEIPAAKVGRHYKILRSDALAYVEKLKNERMKKFEKDE